MDLVRKEFLKDLSVMASQMGYDLYLSLGFEEVRMFYVRVPDEEEELALRAMRYTPKAVE